MEIKGIIFSKDGTILEFNNLWINSSRALIREIIRMKFHEATQEDIDILIQKAEESIGIEGDRFVENAMMSNGTVQDMADAIAQALNIRDQSLPIVMEDFLYEYIQKNKKQIKGVIELKPFFERLKSWGYKTAIATTNSRQITEMTLKELGIIDLIDFIAPSDEYPKKPDPFVIDEFAERIEGKRKNIIVVGDTKIDMVFAQKALCGVGVLSGAASGWFLAHYTDYIIDDISQLLDDNGEIDLEKMQQNAQKYK